jgi:hypothetical protein
MTSDRLTEALDLTARGWPVFPCQPGRKLPATPHGYLDATTDPGQITRFHPPPALEPGRRHRRPRPRRARHRPARPGRAAGRHVGLRPHPSGGLHAYFTGTHQRNGHLPACHIDFRSAGGYVLVPPSAIGGKPYRLIKTVAGHGQLDWPAVTSLLEPARPHQAQAPRQPAGHGTSRLAAWVAAQPEGNRNAGLFWAANRALDADPAADLTPLAAAARNAGLGEAEITRTLNSARHGSRTRPSPTPHPDP